MNFLDLDRVRSARLETDPFPYFVVPGCIPTAARAALSGDFPRIDKVGSFPTSVLDIGSLFAAFLRELEGDAFRAAIADKLNIDLSGRPTMVTVRGQSGARDGNIHADSKTKLVTVLIYMNEQWEAPGGRLRLLRSPDNLNDSVAEVPPDAGTLLAFLVTPHSWHGHAPAFGPRRVIQLNWVTDESVVRREQARHRWSATVKRLLAFKPAEPSPN
ncbi:MAG TPA: 2OG-Fe(II) oxygenase [Stellaceae bacterium]|nr:2OG-Fe(II) oxygenase [Stellaceae bacterium]